MFLFFLSVGVLFLLLFMLWKYPYLVKFDSILAFTGGLGSGKSFLSVKKSIFLLKLNRKKVKRENFKKWLKLYLKGNLKDYKPLPKPLLYSNIPVRISRKEYSVELDSNYLLLVSKLVPLSVCFIDEVGAFANQFQYKDPNIIDNFDEFIRLFRHYTKGGYLVVNDQCSENIVLQIRRRINNVYNLMHFRKIFFFYFVKIRLISISEEIKTVEANDKNTDYKITFGLMPFFKHYDTYCYYYRYTPTLVSSVTCFHRLATNRLLKPESNKVNKLTTSDNSFLPPLPPKKKKKHLFFKRSKKS